jgi:hypothetical protein
VDIDDFGFLQFEMWREDILMPATPHVCEILENGTVQNSTVLKAGHPRVYMGCVVPFGKNSLPTVFAVNVHVVNLTMPEMVRIFLHEHPCTSVGTVSDAGTAGIGSIVNVTSKLF